MERIEYSHYSSNLDREMHIIVYGHAGLPVIGFPCQDSMCNNYEDFGMIDALSSFIEEGKIQMFCVDSVDAESWSLESGIPEWRTARQESYFKYITEEVVPLVMEWNNDGRLPLVTGFSLGATHAAITFLRRPDILSGMIALSGAYDAQYFFGGFMDHNLYNNSPVHFLANMPSDHPYIDLYNQKNIFFCVGQGAWEDEGIRTQHILEHIFADKGINAWCDFWGYDVNHDWPWWFRQMNYFLPKVF